MTVDGCIGLLFDFCWRSLRLCLKYVGYVLGERRQHAAMVLVRMYSPNPEGVASLRQGYANPNGTGMAQYIRHR